VVVRDRRRRGEVAPADSATNEAPPVEFYCSVEEGVLIESCSGGIWISAERGISRRANCLIFALAVFKIHRAPLVFLYRCAFSYSHGQGCQLELINIPLKILLFT
jgi:hypothetical protein